MSYGPGDSSFVFKLSSSQASQAAWGLGSVVPGWRSRATMALLGGSVDRSPWLVGVCKRPGSLQWTPTACCNVALRGRSRSGTEAGMATEQGRSLSAARRSATPASAPYSCAASLAHRASQLVVSHSSNVAQWESLRNGGVAGIATVAAALTFPEVASALEASAGSVGMQFHGAVGQGARQRFYLPTWTIHVASVAEWITAMSLVWQYGETPGKAAWKGLAWGMVPLLGGAMCACTWHFFYNSDSLAELVVLQGALTLIGNFTMWIAAFRIYLAAQEKATAP